LIGPTRRAQVTDHTTQGVLGVAKALGHLPLRLAVHQHRPSGFVASVEGLMRFEEAATGKALLHRADSAV
jgi:hypothetical protein